MKIIDVVKIDDTNEIITVRSNDKWLTNADETLFTKETVWLGIGDSPDNYDEVTEEYKENKELEIKIQNE